MAALPRVESPDVCANFRALAPHCAFPLEMKRWGGHWFITDANDITVCRIEGPMGEAAANMIVVAVNTCGGFRVSKD